MTPQGYISVEDAAKRLGLAQERLIRISDASGIAKFSFRGVVVYRETDLEKLTAAVRSSAPSSAKPAASPAKRDPEDSDDDINVDVLDVLTNSDDSVAGAEFLDLDDSDDDLTGTGKSGKAGTGAAGGAKTGPRFNAPAGAGQSGSGLFDTDEIVRQLGKKGPTAPAPGPGKPAAAKPPTAAKPPAPAGPPRPLLPGTPIGRTPAPKAFPPPPPSAPAPAPKPAAAAPPAPAAPPMGSNRPALTSWAAGPTEGLPAEAFRPVVPVLEPQPTAETDGPTFLVGADRQLFLDAAILDITKNAKRVLNQPVRHALPVIQPDTPWEAGGYCTLAGSVLFDTDDDRLKMWYHASGKAGRFACLATSTDGLHWEKPRLDVSAFEGGPTNIVMAPPTVEGYAELAGVLLDPFAEPERKFKAVFLYQNAATAVRGLKTATSPDGIRWTVGEALLGQVTDLARLTRDTRTGRFSIYGRLNRQGRRCVQRLDSDDFLFWTNGEAVLEPDASDPPADDFYTMAAFPYGRHYLGLVQVFHGPPHCTVDVQLAGSRDGWKWERLGDRGTFLANGRPGEWDRHQISPADAPVVVNGRELWFYYGGRSRRQAPYNGPDRGPDWGAIGLATLRLDGFCHMEGGFDGGVFTTQPVLLRNKELRVNANSTFGQLHVQLLDAESRPIDGMMSRPIVADSVDQPVVWQSGRDLSSWATRPMRLKFLLKNARVYSFWTQ
jgi:hypothetical protein